MKKRALFFILSIGVLLTACSTTKMPHDYSHFVKHQPKSILVVAPTNSTSDVRAVNSVLSYLTKPLAESGYYVFPVSLVDQTFKDNGISEPAEIKNISPKRLHSIFGADAALFVNVEQYGTTYYAFGNSTSVRIHGELVDLKTGNTLWSNTGVAVADSSSNSGNVLLDLVVTAVDLAVKNSTDFAHAITPEATSSLVGTDADGGLLYGAYHPEFGKDTQLTSESQVLKK